MQPPRTMVPQLASPLPPPTPAQITNACGVCVVVSRWFGGVLLGPARFTHINNAARQLLAAEGCIAAAPAGKGPRSRK